MTKTEYCLIAQTNKAYTFQSTLIKPAGDHETVLLRQLTRVRRPFKIESSQQCQTLFWHIRNFPTRGACLSAGLLWCLLTQEAYPEASATPQQPICKSPSPLEEYFVLCCPDSVSHQQHQNSSQGFLGTVNKWAERASVTKLDIKWSR